MNETTFERTKKDGKIGEDFLRFANLRPNNSASY
jgi:hypothetical protein